MLGWARDYLSGPAPLVTFAVLAALGIAVTRPLARWRGWPAAATGATLLTLAAIAAVTLLPAPGHTLSSLSVEALPECGRSLVDAGDVWAGLTTGRRGERLANVVMFLPLTFFGTLATRRPAPVALLAVLLPPVIELSQALTAAGRICAGFDWACNGLGALGGSALAVLALRVAGR